MYNYRILPWGRIFELAIGSKFNEWCITKFTPCCGKDKSLMQSICYKKKNGKGRFRGTRKVVFAVLQK